MNDDTGVPAAVFALKPEWADLILSGAKTVEIRRGRMKRMIGRMLIYRTGTGLIVGEARVKGMHAAPPETIWRGYGTESRIPKNLFEEYAKGADRLYAYRLENPIRYSDSLCLFMLCCTHTVWKTPSATGSRRLCPTSD